MSPSVAPTVPLESGRHGDPLGWWRNGVAVRRPAAAILRAILRDVGP
jgi:hypothetical protein